MTTMAPGDRQPQGTAIDGSMPMEHVAIDMLTKDRLCAEGRIESTRDDTSRHGRTIGGSNRFGHEIVDQARDDSRFWKQAWKGLKEGIGFVPIEEGIDRLEDRLRADEWNASTDAIDAEEDPVAWIELTKRWKRTEHGFIRNKETKRRRSMGSFERGRWSSN